MVSTYFQHFYCNCNLYIFRSAYYAFRGTGDIHDIASDFLSLILLGAVFQTFAMAMNNIVRSEGNAKTAMLTMIISAILNMILNPIFIMGFGMGVRGSALATVIAQAVGAIWLLIYFLSGKSTLSLKGFSFRMDFPLIRRIMAIGFPSFIMMSAGSIVTVAVNWMLNIYGGTMAIAELRTGLRRSSLCQSMVSHKGCNQSSASTTVPDNSNA
ncbi:Multidrug export protein mepA [Listeria monocytogenes N53-1]|nr:Multidrug export protein mepA [Listeria monocytogenes N53-1]